MPLETIPLIGKILKCIVSSFVKSKKEEVVVTYQKKSVEIPETTLTLVFYPVNSLGLFQRNIDFYPDESKNIKICYVIKDSLVLEDGVLKITAFVVLHNRIYVSRMPRKPVNIYSKSRERHVYNSECNLSLTNARNSLCDAIYMRITIQHRDETKKIKNIDDLQFDKITVKLSNGAAKRT